MPLDPNSDNTLDRNFKKNLQFSQHIIALIHSITLRVLRNDAITTLYQNLEGIRSFKDRFENEDEFVRFLKDIAELAPLEAVEKYKKEIENFADNWLIESKWMWMTLPSNPNPYHRRAVQNKYLKAICRLFHLTVLVGKKDDSKCITELNEIAVSLKEGHGVMVGGFIWDSPRGHILLDSNELDKHIRDMIKNVLKMQGLFPAVPNPLTKDELEFLAHQRVPISKDRLQIKVKQIKSSFGQLINVFNDYGRELSALGRSERLAFINGVAFFNKNDVVNLIEDATKGRQRVTLSSDPLKHCFVQKIGEKAEVLYEFEDHVLSSIELNLVSDTKAPMESNHELIKIDQSLELLAPNFPDRINTRFFNFIEAIVAKMKSRENEFLLELHCTSSGQMGQIC